MRQRGAPPQANGPGASVAPGLEARAGEKIGFSRRSVDAPGKLERRGGRSVAAACSAPRRGGRADGAPRASRALSEGGGVAVVRPWAGPSAGIRGLVTDHGGDGTGEVVRGGGVAVGPEPVPVALTACGDDRRGVLTISGLAFVVGHGEERTLDIGCPAWAWMASGSSGPASAAARRAARLAVKASESRGAFRRGMPLETAWKGGSSGRARAAWAVLKGLAMGRNQGGGPCPHGRVVKGRKEGGVGASPPLLLPAAGASPRSGCPPTVWEPSAGRLALRPRREPCSLPGRSARSCAAG